MWSVDAFSAGVYRRRRGILLGGTVLAAAGVALAVATRGVAVVGVLAALGVLAFVVMSVVGNVLYRRRRVTFVEVVPERPAFATPGLATGTLLWLSLLFLTAAGAGLGLVNPDGTMTGTIRALVLVLAVVLPAGLAPVVVRGSGVRMTPEGFGYTTSAGAVSVPWDALRPGDPVEVTGDFTVALWYECPDLVSVRGFVPDRRRMWFEGVDAGLVAAVVRHYVAHVEDRAAIGTPEELDRLREVVTAHPVPKKPTRPPSWTGTVIALLIFVGMAAASTAEPPTWADMLTIGVGSLALNRVVRGVWGRLRRKRT